MLGRFIRNRRGRPATARPDPGSLALADPVRAFVRLAAGRFPAEPVALLRIAGALVVLADLVATWSLAPLIWGPENHPALIHAAYGAWAAALLLVLVGYRTTLAAVASYLLTFPLLYLLPEHFEYHIDYYIRSWAFFLVFLRSHRAYSIDSWLARRRRRPATGANAAGAVPAAPARTVPLVVVILFVAQLSLDYFDAGFWKLGDREMWGQGLGLYWPLVVRYGSTGLGRSIIEAGWLIVPLGYLALAWELGFPLLMLSRLTRRLAIAFGVVFHLGIIALLPIHFFGELMLAFYLLFLPRDWIVAGERRLARVWQRLRGHPEGGDGPHGDAIAASANGRASPVAPPATPRRRRAAALLLAAGLSWLVAVKAAHLGFIGPPLAAPLAATAARVHSFVTHPVFMAFHFRRTGVVEVELETAGGGRERFGFMEPDGYPGALMRRSTRVWVYMLRMGIDPRPRHFATVLVRWIEATRPDVCAVVLTQRLVTAPPEYRGDVDVWSDAPRRPLGRITLPRPASRCPPAGP